MSILSRSRLTGAILLLAAATARPARAQTAPDSTALRLARQAATAWLAFLDSGRVGESWDSAASAFRAQVTRTDWENALIHVRGPLEPFGERKLRESSYTTALPGAPPGEYVVLRYETRVTAGKKVIETVVPARDTDGVWRVSGYYVRPH